jgi:apolipoprotein N-acyltransferase
VLAVAFAAVEWLRGHVLTGFPWNAFGYTLTPVPLMMQSASLVGIWGLTLVAFIVFAAPALLAAPERGGRRGRILFLAFAAALFVAHVGFGALRLATASDATLADVRSIVQRRSSREMAERTGRNLPSPSRVSDRPPAGAASTASPISSGPSRRSRFF